MTTDSQSAVAAAPAPSTTQAVRAVRRGDEIIATGRRKTAVARVRLRPGNGEVTINGRDLEAYFPSVNERNLVAGAGADGQADGREGGNHRRRRRSGRSGRCLPLGDRPGAEGL